MQQFQPAPVDAPDAMPTATDRALRAVFAFVFFAVTIASIGKAFTRTDDRHVRGTCCLANGRLFTLVRTNNLATVASRARMDGYYVRDYLNRGSSDECDHQQR